MPAAPAHAELRALRAACTRTLCHHPPAERAPARMLAALLAHAGEEELPDQYGAGALIEDFEARVARLLGKPAARFFPSGTMAQLVAARVWGAETGRPRIAFHPSAHLELHEEGAYRELHRLERVLLGAPDRVLGLMDLLDLPADVGMVLVELPMRELGGALPRWEALVGMVATARTGGARVHLDGARLWEASAGYERSPAQIAALFDSVYVSFYKGLGGISGAILAGPTDFVAAALPWQRRHGGNLVTQWPAVLSARVGLDTRLGRMGAYRDHMRAIAEALRPIDGLRMTPDPPQVNMVHLRLRGEPAGLTAAVHALSRRTGIWLFPSVRPTDQPGEGMVELVVGDATLDFTPAEVACLFRDLLS